MLCTRVQGKLKLLLVQHSSLLHCGSKAEKLMECSSFGEGSNVKATANSATSKRAIWRQSLGMGIETEALVLPGSEGDTFPMANELMLVCWAESALFSAPKKGILSWAGGANSIGSTYCELDSV